jgi:hypothetical protein
MTFEKYGENLRPTGGREVFFPNFPRLIRLVEKRMYEKYIFGRGF